MIYKYLSIVKLKYTYIYKIFINITIKIIIIIIIIIIINLQKFRSLSRDLTRIKNTNKIRVKVKSVWSKYENQMVVIESTI